MFRIWIPSCFGFGFLHVSDLNGDSAPDGGNSLIFQDGGKLAPKSKSCELQELALQSWNFKDLAP